jgi:hypothetical protein
MVWSGWIRWKAAKSDSESILLKVTLVDGVLLDANWDRPEERQ